MVIADTIIVLLASLINDWCAAYTHLEDPLQTLPAYMLYGRRIQLASLALFAVGCVVLWIGQAGVWMLAGAVAWFFVFSSWLNFPLLEHLNLLPKGWMVSRELQQLLGDGLHHPRWTWDESGREIDHRATFPNEDRKPEESCVNDAGRRGLRDTPPSGDDIR